MLPGIHRLSGRRGRFVSINCTHLPADATALRSELLGHVKGAFTGAVEAKVGQLFLADGGTLFLDEVESLGRDAQAFLLTLLEGSDDLVPLGAPAAKGRPRPSFRLISATKQRLNESPLRHDLAQRLGAGDFIHVPSLEERREDIPTLAQRFVEELAAEQQVDCALAVDDLEYLMRQQWPGQIRELQATVKATAVRCWWRTNNAAAPSPAASGCSTTKWRTSEPSKRSSPASFPPLFASSATRRTRSAQARHRGAPQPRDLPALALRRRGGRGPHCIAEQQFPRARLRPRAVAPDGDHGHEGDRAAF